MLRVLFACVGISILVPSVSWAQNKNKSKPVPPAVDGARGDRSELKPGDPLSARALTSKPAPIKGIASWTLETRRHRSYLSVMAASPDGTQLATGGIDGTIRIWDSETGKLVKALVGHNSYVYGLSWSPDGKTITSGGAFDYSVKLWDVESGRTLRTLKGHQDWVGQVAWSPKGDRFVAVGGHSGWLWLWEAAAEQKKDLTSSGQYVSWVCWAPDGDRLAVTAQQLPIMVIDTFGSEKTLHLGKHDDGYTSVAWSPDGKRLATGSATQVAIWNLGSSSEKPSAEKTSPDDNKDANEKPDGSKAVTSDLTPTVIFKTPAVSLAWAPDGSKLAVASGTDVQLWDVSAKEAKSVSKLPGTATKLTWLGKGTKLAGMASTQWFVWDTAESKLLRTTDAAGLTPPLWTHNRPIISGLGTPKLALWDLSTGKSLRSLEGHTASVAAAAWSRDGKFIATGSHDKTARIWEASSGKLLHTLGDHKAPVTCVAFSLDGKTLASGGSEPIVRLWNVSTGKPDGELKGHAGPITVVSFPPSGAGFASGSADKTVKLWNVGKQQLVRSVDVSGHVYSLAWTGDGKNQTLACGTASEQVHLIQVQSGKLLGNFSHGGSPPYVAGVAWSPDGSALFAGRGNHTAQVWDARANKVVHNFATMAPVQYVAWPAGSSVVVAGNQDRTVRLWDARSGQLGGLIIEEPNHVVQLSGDGHFKLDPDREPDLIVVSLSDEGLTTHSVSDFAAKTRWKNLPASVRLGGK